MVQDAAYTRHAISYRTFDRNATEVLRLTAPPRSVTTGGRTLRRRGSLVRSGYTVKTLDDGNVVVRIHHMTSPVVVVTL